MNITNTHKGPVALPNGQELLPGVSTPVHKWAEIKKNVVVAAWLKAGVLREGDSAPKADNTKLLAPDKEALAAELKALGVKFHPNTGAAKLKALLDKAKAEKAEADKGNAGDEPEA